MTIKGYSEAEPSVGREARSRRSDVPGDRHLMYSRMFLLLRSNVQSVKDMYTVWMPAARANENRINQNIQARRPGSPTQTLPHAAGGPPRGLRPLRGRFVTNLHANFPRLSSTSGALFPAKFQALRAARGGGRIVLLSFPSPNRRRRNVDVFFCFCFSFWKDADASPHSHMYRRLAFHGRDAHIPRNRRMALK